MTAADPQPVDTAARVRMLAAPSRDGDWVRVRAGELRAVADELDRLAARVAKPDAAAIVEMARSALDRELAKMTAEVAIVKDQLTLAQWHLSRGEVLIAAEKVFDACDTEYKLFGHCEHSGQLAELIHTLHTGSAYRRYCGVPNCDVCAVLTKEPGR